MQRIKTFAQKHKRLLIILVLIFAIGLIGYRVAAPTTPQITYQTAPVEKGTIVSAVSGSGQVATSGRLSITTQASGVIKEVYVKNGQAVTAGQKIASINLDPAGQIKNSSAWASYLAARSSLNSANAGMYSTQGTMLTAWQKYMDQATSNQYENSDGSPNTSNRAGSQFVTTQDSWLSAEALYKNQQTQVSQAQAALGTAWLSYSQSSPDIVAPQAGLIDDLTIAPGMVISAPSTTTQVASQTVASILTDSLPSVAINLSETDVNSVKEGNKVTVTIDALPGKTFAGKVVGVNKAGVVSSGVTNYPATILLDTKSTTILPNMTASANIITSTKHNVLLVPSEAVQTRNDSSYVQVLKNGKPVDVEVETGITSDTQTEIVSGIQEGQVVVIGQTGGQTTAAPAAQSPFNTSFRIGGGATGGGGGVRRIQ